GSGERFGHAALASMAAEDDRPRSELILPKPETRHVSAYGTPVSRGSPLNWRIASTRPSEPPAAPACPTESCPPEVLCGNVPSLVKLWERTKSGPSPFLQKPRSSSCIMTMTG